MMKYRLQDLIDIEHFQNLQDRLNKIYSFPSSIIDNDGNILTATAWQDVCTKFHRKNKEMEQLCIKSDQYISDHIHEAKPAISYRCPHGLMDNAIPIIIDGIHYGNFFTGQFFLEKPDLEFFRSQGQKYGFDEEAYISAVKKVPIWTQEQLENYLFFIKGLITVISESGMKNLKEIEYRKQIQKSEKRYRSILKAAIDGYWLTDTNGRLLEVNDAYCRMSGYNEGELLNMHISELEFVETPEIIAEHMQAVVMKGSDRFETRHRRKDGTVFDVEVSIQFRPEDGGQCVCFLRNIADRKRAEKALKESEERYNLAMDASRDGVYEWDLETREIYYSPGWKRMLGYEPDELPDDFSVWEKLTRPGDVEKSWQMMKELIEGKRDRFEVEFQMQHKDGHWVHILSRSNIYKDANGERVRVVGTHVDITDNKHQRERLRLSESRYRKAQVLGKVGNWEYNLKTAEFWGSDEAKKLFELDPDKDSFSVEEVESCIIERERVHQALVDLIENGKPYNLEYDIITKNTGKIKTFVSIAEIETDGAKNPGKISGVIHDITERKQAEEALKSNYALLQIAGETAIFGGWSVDLEKNICTWSDAVSDIHDVPHGCAPPVQEAINFYAPEWREKITHVFSACAKDGIPYDEEMEIITQKGKRVWVRATGKAVKNEKGKIIKVQGSFQDITERKQAEQKYQTLFREMLNGFALHEIICDATGVPVDYRFLDVNPAFERMTGLKAQEIIGKTILEILPRTERHWIELYGKVAHTGEAAFFENYHAELSMHFEVTAFRPAPSQFACIFSDITMRKLAEAERERLQTQLLQAQKMESVGRLAGGVAHDFNNMLGVISGRAELGLKKTAPTDPVHKDLEQILNAADRSADITRQLLAFARKQTIAPKVIDLNDTVDTILQMLGRLIGEHIDLQWQPVDDLWSVKMDPSQLDQILVNLCVNARDAIADVGKITIETGMKVFDTAYCDLHAGFVPGEFVLLAVSDDGCGMDRHTLGNLFEPFFTTKQTGRGTGMGLATVYGIIKQNNGFINVYSEPEKGSSFRIYLPRSTEDMAEKIPKKYMAPSPRGSGETILIVEDEATIMEMLEIMLESLNYTVIAADSPSRAMEMAHSHAGQIHLIITDVVMPEMNGRDLAEKMSALYPGINILFMSGYTANVIAHQGVLDEGVAFIQKPFSMADLSEKLREILDTAPDQTKQ